MIVPSTSRLVTGVVEPTGAAWRRAVDNVEVEATHVPAYSHDVRFRTPLD